MYLLPWIKRCHFLSSHECTVKDAVRHWCESDYEVQVYTILISGELTDVLRMCSNYIKFELHKDVDWCQF